MAIHVYRDREGQRDLLGRIEHDQTHATFQYNQDYLARATANSELGVSVLLPLDPDAYPEEDLGPFFLGLLPEGETLANLSLLYQTPRSDYLTLLEQLGCESIGALTFLSEDVDAEEYEPRYDPVSPETVEQMNSNPARMATMAASSTRLSLAGAQSKVAWYLPKGKVPQDATCSDWLIPRGTAPSTHIVKISRKGEEDIALNELACSLLARECGIETAAISRLPEVPGAISIERYDRKFLPVDGEERLLRLHQEDFCQALGFAPFYKYQPKGTSASYPLMASSLIERVSDNPQRDKLEFARRLLFCYAIGNSDAHLKNFSLLYNQEWTGRRLAPLYDVTCIPLTGYSTDMPFDIGAHRRIDEIDARDITQVALDLDTGFSSLDDAISDMLAVLESPSLGDVDDEIQTMIERILENAKPRLNVLGRFLGK